MSFQIVQCEVRWFVSVGYTGNELPPAKYETLGEFETEHDAEQALVNAGFTRSPYSWRDSSGYGYGHGSVTRVLKEIK